MTDSSSRSKDIAPAWHARDISTILDELSTDPERGLAPDEAVRRLRRYGPNRLPEGHHTRWYEVLARQYLDPLVGILFVAAALSVAVGELSDALTIVAILLLNGVLGFTQEWRAEKALLALRRMLTQTARVVRDGEVVEIDAADLVPGDIVLVEAGDRVPADLRLLETVGLQVDESALTGESVPVAKDAATLPEDVPLAARRNLAWMGTVVTNGSGRGVVVATGPATVFGRIAGMTSAVERAPTTLQRKLERLSRQLGAAALTIAALVIVAGLLHQQKVLDVLLTGISLAVAVVPEGLPAVVTLTLALGVRMLVRRRVLLRRLQAAETLGALTVICTDKTGTLTVNQMTIREILTADGRHVQVTGSGYEPVGTFALDDGSEIGGDELLDRLLYAGLVCNHARLIQQDGLWSVIGDPTEGALTVAARKRGLTAPEGRLVGEISFTSKRMRMSVIEAHRDGVRLWIKGAPEVILSRCSRIAGPAGELPLTERERREILERADKLARDGYRLLPLAWRPLDREPAEPDADTLEQDLIFLGLVAMVDPPRPEVPEAIATARRAGIRVIMITGDAPATAAAIAAKIGLAANDVISGNEIGKLSDDELSRRLAGPGVLFARAAPEDKIRIVRLLQAQGEVVGMTGDGVNDAPALRQADVGIAMGLRGTDVAREAGDVVLTDDNFASIVAGVEEGRRQGDNISKFIQYLLSSNTGEIVAIATNMFLGGPVLLLPVQILWMNLVTDGATAVALGLEPAEPDVMKRPPRSPRQPILDRSALLRILLLGGWLGVATLLMFAWGQGRENLAEARTLAFTGLVVAEKLNVFNFRSLRYPLGHIGCFSNPWLWAAWSVTVGAQIAAVYVAPLQRALHTVPLTASDWAMMLAVALPVLIVPQAWRRVRERSTAP